MFGLLMREFDSWMFNQAIEYFKTTLDLDNSSIPIEIKLVDNIGRGKTDGTCGPRFTSDSTHDNLKIEKIEIQVKQHATTIGTITALAHEMVHARQIIRGDTTSKIEKRHVLGFIPYFVAKTYWKGVDVSDLEYYDRPSEQEAFLLQKMLTRDFLIAIGDAIEPSNMASLLHAKL